MKSSKHYTSYANFIRTMINQVFDEQTRLHSAADMYLGSIPLPPAGTINNACKSSQHGIPYVSVNKTNKAR